MRVKYAWMMVAAVIVLAALFRGLGYLNINRTGLNLEPGWNSRPVVVWRNAHPEMLALSPDGKWLYASCDTKGNEDLPSLAAINLKTSSYQILVSGLVRVDGLKFAPDGSLWIGEKFPQGLIWRVADVDHFPVGQKVDRARMVSNHPGIAPFYAAGRFAHEGIAFSRNKQFAYLADAAVKGSLYRLSLRTHQMQVLLADQRWSAIFSTRDIPHETKQLQVRAFNQIEDMETLPDGRILISEAGTKKILVLSDTDKHPVIDEYLYDSRIAHPDNLAWDATRQWLWISDDSKPSQLWVWNGQKLLHIATHKYAKITGVLPIGKIVYINLQNRSDGPELTLRLSETPIDDFK